MRGKDFYWSPVGHAPDVEARLRRRFAADGAWVVVSDINADTAEATAATIESAIAIPADVTDESQVQALVEQTVVGDRYEQERELGR